MGTVAVQSDILELLETAGARPRGNRHDCPKCGGLRTVTHTEECFYCHKCGWKGNGISLAKELGIHRRIPSPEYRELCRTRERAHDAAERLYRAAKARRFELYDRLRILARVEAGAHRAGLSETAWRALAMAHREQPAIEAELDRLGSGNAGTVLECLSEAKV